MEPKFLNQDIGSGKVVSDLLNTIFNIIGHFGLVEVDYCNYKTIDVDDFVELQRCLEMIDIEMQEGVKWEIK